MSFNINLVFNTTSIFTSHAHLPSSNLCFSYSCCRFFFIVLLCWVLLYIVTVSASHTPRSSNVWLFVIESIKSLLLCMSMLLQNCWNMLNERLPARIPHIQWVMERATVEKQSLFEWYLSDYKQAMNTNFIN